MGKAHTLLVDAAKQWLKSLGAMAWGNNTGTLVNRFGTPVKYGHPGSSDVFGVLPDGRFVAAEAKTRNDKPTTLQSKFLHAVAERGGCACVFRNLDELETHVETYLEGSDGTEAFGVGGCVCDRCRQHCCNPSKTRDVAR